jgi:flagella synthesis protein FlgN
MAAIDELKQLLNQDVESLRQLAATLTAERDALACSDIQAIETLTRDKNALLDQVRERARQKIRVLVVMGYKPEAGAPSRFLRSAGIEELSSLWAAAEKQLRSCHEINGVNSRVVGHLQQRLSRLTDIFRGSAGQAKLYGASGHQTSLGQRNSLASA